jgi:hypothetical protein
MPEDKFSSWLTRAGSAPLSILLHHHQLAPSPSDAVRPELPALFRRIIAGSSRWRNVSLRFPLLDLLDSRFQSVVEGNLSILESLDINVSYARPTNSATVPLTAFQNAPRLCAVSLTSVPSALIVFRGHNSPALPLCML